MLEDLNRLCERHKGSLILAPVGLAEFSRIASVLAVTARLAF